MTLRSHFSLLIGSVVVMTVSLYTAALVLTERRHLEREDAQRWRTAAEHMAQVCGQSLVNHNNLPVLAFFRELNKEPGFVEAMCLDAAGRVGLNSKLNASALGFSTSKFVSGTKVVELSGKIYGIYDVSPRAFQDSLAGARVVVDRSVGGARVKDTMKRTVHRSAGVAGGFLLLGVLLSWATARTLTRPILELAAGTRRVAQRDWAVRVPTRSPGELGALAREFNTMSKKLGDLDRLKDQFVYTVSHDLRNPLGAIAASAKILRKDPLPPASQEIVDVIETSAVRLNAMVNNILDLACLQEGALTFVPKPFSLSDLTRSLSVLFQPLATESRRELVLEVPTDLPRLVADEEKVFRIFLNFLANAFKFTRPGDRLTLAARVLSPGIVECRVSDTGRGISKDRLPHLFEPHRSREGATKEERERQGAGLGLSITKALVEGHGGSLRVESAEGRGATFFFTLPSETRP